MAVGWLGGRNGVMGHEDIKTTEGDTQVATGMNGCGVKSPLDQLPESGRGVIFRVVAFRCADRRFSGSQITRPGPVFSQTGLRVVVGIGSQNRPSSIARSSPVFSQTRLRVEVGSGSPSPTANPTPQHSASLSELRVSAVPLPPPPQHRSSFWDGQDESRFTSRRGRSVRGLRTRHRGTAWTRSGAWLGWRWRGASGRVPGFRRVP